MSYTDHSAQRLFKSNTPIHFICDRVCKHRESITTGSRKSPTSRLRFQFRPRLQAPTLAIGLFGATWSRTHLVYRWNIPTIQTVWGEPKLNHSLYRQLQPGRVWVCLQNAVVTAANSHINNYYKNIISLQPVGPLSLVSPWASAPWSPCINAPLPIWVFGSRSAFTVTPEVFSWD